MFEFGGKDVEPASTVSSVGLFQSTMCGVPSISHRKRLFCAGSWKLSKFMRPALLSTEEGTVLGTNGIRDEVGSSLQVSRITTLVVEVGLALGAVS